MLHFKKRLLMN